jgi:predicted nucleic acid-binding protein
LRGGVRGGGRSEYDVSAAKDEPDNQHGALGVPRHRIPDDALHLAARTYLAYRRRGGSRSGTLPDFFIGAHEKVSGAQILTRDHGRYWNYFPDVALITP